MDRVHLQAILSGDKIRRKFEASKNTLEKIQGLKKRLSLDKSELPQEQLCPSATYLPGLLTKDRAQHASSLAVNRFNVLCKNFSSILDIVAKQTRLLQEEGGGSVRVSIYQGSSAAESTSRLFRESTSAPQHPHF
jgi:hypothetical protein